jgi:hypothetical protein
MCTNIRYALKYMDSGALAGGDDLRAAQIRKHLRPKLAARCASVQVDGINVAPSVHDAPNVEVCGAASMAADEALR